MANMVCEIQQLNLRVGKAYTRKDKIPKILAKVSILYERVGVLEKKSTP